MASPKHRLTFIATNYSPSTETLLNLLGTKPHPKHLRQPVLLKHSAYNRYLTELITNFNIVQTLGISSHKTLVLPDLSNRNVPKVNLSSGISTEVPYVDEYVTLSVFINDFFNAKAAKRTSILTRTSYHAAEPNTVVYTSTLKRNQLNTKTFNPRSRKIRTPASSLLFYRQMVSGHKQLLTSVSQKVKTNNLNLYKHIQSSQGLHPNAFIIESPFLFTNPRNSNKSKKQTTNKVRNSRIRAPKTTFRTIKPSFGLRSASLQKFMRRYKFTKTSNSLFSFLEKYTRLKKTRRTLKKVWNNRRDIFIQKTKKISYNLSSAHKELKSCNFYYNYAPKFTLKFLRAKSARSRIRNNFYFTKINSRLTRKRPYKSRMRSFTRFKKSSQSNKFKLIKSNNARRLRRLFNSSNPKNTKKNNLTTHKKKIKNYSMTNTRIFSKKRYLLTKSIFRVKKNQAQVLTNKSKYKNVLQKVSKYIKKRLVLPLSDITNTSYKGTRKFKVDRLLTSTSKPYKTSVPFSLNHPNTKLIVSSRSKHFKLNLLFNSDNFTTMFMNSPFLMKFISKTNQEVTKR